MTTRTMVCVAIHGDTDFEERKAYVASQAALEIEARRLPEGHVPKEPICEVIAVLTSQDGSRLERHITDWNEAALYKKDTSYIVTVALA